MTTLGLLLLIALSCVAGCRGPASGPGVAPRDETANQGAIRLLPEILRRLADAGNAEEVSSGSLAAARLGRVWSDWRLPDKAVPEEQVFARMRPGSTAEAVLESGGSVLGAATLFRIDGEWVLVDVGAGSAPGYVLDEALEKLRLRIRYSSWRRVVNSAGGDVILATDGRRVVGVFVRSGGAYMWEGEPPMAFPDAGVVYEWPQLKRYLWYPGGGLPDYPADDYESEVSSDEPTDPQIQCVLCAGPARGPGQGQ